MVTYFTGELNMRKNLFFILIGTGLLFFINAVFGRYIVLPGYFNSLDRGAAAGRNIPEGYPVWKIVRYLIWAFSFKLGSILFLTAFLVKNSYAVKKILTMTALGLVYLGTAYIELPYPGSAFFGIGGSIITIAMCIVFALFSSRSNRAEGNENTQENRSLAKAGAFFMFAMASYNLCPLLGIKAFALQPEKMIQYGLKDDAVSFAAHIMIELCTGWVLLAVSRIPWIKKRHGG